MNPMSPRSEHLDCRGQQCPQPILTTAKAARQMRGRGGGVIEIEADDDAFPLDIRSWCRSSGSELVGVTSDPSGRHLAIVRIPGEANESASVPSLPERPKVELVDCRGMQCPQPILTVARRAKNLGAPEFEVVADDPAFELDLESWGRSSGARVEWLEKTGGVWRAMVRLAAATTAVPRPPTPAVKSPVPRPTAPPGDEVGVAFDMDVSLSSLADDQRLARLEAIGRSLSPGETVRIRCQGTEYTTPLLRWAATAGHDVVSFDARTDTTMVIRAGATTPLAVNTASTNALEVVRTENRCTLLVLHNDKEALLAALLVANGAAAQGMEVVLFFTFWGLNLLRGDEPNTAEKEEQVSWMQRMMKWMMPKGPRRQKLGQMDMGGIGRGMLKSIMDSYKIMDIPELMEAAEEQGCRFIACTMSMQVMGITKRDLAPRSNLEFGGVAAFVESAGRSNLSLMF